MKLWPLCVVVVLAACAPVEISPDAAIADARATQGAAQAQMRSTEKAANRERANATLQAAATQGAAQVEIDLLAARLDATQQAQDMEIERARVTDAAMQLQVTQTAAAEIAARTQVAQNLQATTSAMQAMATQTATVLDMELAERDAARRGAARDIWFGVAVVGGSIFIAGLMTLIFWVVARYLPRFLDWTIEWVDRPRRYQETRAGSVVELEGRPVLIAQLPETGARLLPARGAVSSPVTALTRSGSVLSSPMEPGITTMTIAFLRACEQVAGAGADQLPRWDKVGWSSKPARRVIAALEAVGGVIVKTGTGTFVCDEHQTIGNLLFAVEMKKLVISRVTPPPDSDEE